MSALLTIQWIIILVGLTGGALMFWSSSLLPAHRNRPQRLPYISIIVPARNEEGRIEALLQSLAQQSFQQFELIVVDDGSTDRTVMIAERYQAVVVPNERVEHMGSGKSYACWTGAKRARGKWLLFLDADTKFVQPTSLEVLLSSYADHGATGILSVQPYHMIQRLYENFSAVFNIIVMVGINLFTPWRGKLPAAGAFGPCLLCDRENYFEAGGHEKATHAIMDDFALADAFRDKQLPVFCYGGKSIISFRMYPEGWRQLTEGWTKNFATASASTHKVVMLLISAWMCGGFVSIAGLVFSLYHSSPFALGISIACYLLYAGQTLYLARKTGRFHSWIFLFFPLLLLFFTGVFVYSLYRTRVVGSVTWKGRKIKV